MPHTELRSSARPNNLPFRPISTSEALQSRRLTTERYRLPATSPIAARFGMRLRQLRLKSGMTQVELASYLGLDRSYLSDVEGGKKNMSLSYLETVAQGFKISLAELLTDL